MTDPPPPPRSPVGFTRRATDRVPGETTAQRWRKVSRFMQEDPVNRQWLGEHNYLLLQRVARDIARAGYREAASRVRAIADEHRSGDVSPF